MHILAMIIFNWISNNFVTYIVFCVCYFQDMDIILFRMIFDDIAGLATQVNCVVPYLVELFWFPRIFEIVSIVYSSFQARNSRRFFHSGRVSPKKKHSYPHIRARTLDGMRNDSLLNLIVTYNQIWFFFHKAFTITTDTLIILYTSLYRLVVKGVLAHSPRRNGHSGLEWDS